MAEYQKTSYSGVPKASSAEHDGSKKTEKIPAQELMPTGVLAIHIKRCKNLKVIEAGTKAFSKRLPVSLYIKIMVGDITKMTSINDVRCGNNVGSVFDDLKHFLVTINNKLDDESNKIRFILMGFQGNNKHRKLGEKEVHLFNIIRNLFIVETLEFAKNAHVMGEVEMEMAFSYGCFGYGYSSQLESKNHTPTEQISQSLFFRAEAPNDRKHDTKDIMTAMPIPHPPFVNWPVQVDIVMGGRDFMTESINELFMGQDKGKREYPHLMAAMSKRMPELQHRYASFTKRSQRLSFLQSLVTAKINPDLEENQDDMLFSKDTGTKQRSAESFDHHHIQAGFEYDSPGLLSRISHFFGFNQYKKEEQKKPAEQHLTVATAEAAEDSANVTMIDVTKKQEEAARDVQDDIPMINITIQN